jgi:hypothetical protein
MLLHQKLLWTGMPQHISQENLISHWLQGQ